MKKKLHDCFGQVSRKLSSTVVLQRLSTKTKTAISWQHFKPSRIRSWERVAIQLGLEPKAVLTPGRYARRVKARSLLGYRRTREHGMTTVDPAGRLTSGQPTVSQAVIRGLKIAEDQGLSLIEYSSQ